MAVDPVSTGITAALDATAAIANLAKQRDAEKNTAAMEKNAEAAVIQEARDQANADVASGDLARIQKDSSDAAD